VNDREEWHLLDPDVLSWIFQTQPDYQLVRRLFELRKMIEPAAAALAAERRTSEHLEVMASALSAMRIAKTVDKEWRDADEQFHAALLDASSNPFLVSLTSSINTAMSWSTIYKQRDGPLRRDPVPDHKKVYQAIANSKPVAAYEAMMQLVDLALSDIRDALGLPEITV
jgi:DNA-binding FadR family transcriptional regulator